MRSGLQQKKLAEMAKVPTSSLSRMLSGDEPNAELASVLPVVRALGLRMSDIFDGDDEMRPVVSPYDRNADYRRMIDTLETLASHERRDVIDLCNRIAEVPSDERGEIIQFVAFVLRRREASDGVMARDKHNSQDRPQKPKRSGDRVAAPVMAVLPGSEVIDNEKSVEVPAAQPASGLGRSGAGSAESRRAARAAARKANKG